MNKHLSSIFFRTETSTLLVIGFAYDRLEEWGAVVYDVCRASVFRILLYMKRSRIKFYFTIPCVTRWPGFLDKWSGLYRLQNPSGMGKGIRFDFAFFGQLVRERREGGWFNLCRIPRNNSCTISCHSFGIQRLHRRVSNNHTACTYDFYRSYFTCRIRMSNLLRTIDFCVRFLQDPTKYTNICLFLISAVLSRFRLTYFFPNRADDVWVN